MRRQNLQLFVSRRICQSPANATHLLRNLAPALLAHMLLLVSKWKCFVLMFLLSSLGSMQSLSLPPFFPAVFRASAEAASSLILQIMPSAVTFYSSSSGLFSPQKISQHCGCVTMHCVLPPSHQWAQAPEQCLPSSVPVATSSVAPGVTTVRTRVSWQWWAFCVSMGLGVVPCQVCTASAWTVQVGASLASLYTRRIAANFTCIPECHSHAVCRQAVSTFYQSSFCICSSELFFNAFRNNSPHSSEESPNSDCSPCVSFAGIFQRRI